MPWQDDDASHDGIAPFVVPTDEELFKTIAETKSRSRLFKAETREGLRPKKIHEKSTFASRMQATFVKPSGKSVCPPREASETSEQMSRPVAADGEKIKPFIRYSSGETVAEFLSKKREIFLVQMNLDTKRAEICKLEQRALQRENALKRSEEMLEEDAIKFDAFLKENDEKVQHALKNAEAETRRKQDKAMLLLDSADVEQISILQIAEIKRLQAEMAAIRSEVNKYEEQLEDFRQYKAFLDDITPREWFQEQEKKREKMKEEKMEQWRRQCEAVKKRKADAAASKHQAEMDYNDARTQQEAKAADKRLKDAIENLKVVPSTFSGQLLSTALSKASKLLKEPPKPSVNEEGDSKEEDETYFKTPQQLLDLYVALEEQNLFLVQNLQETEESLDQSRNKLTATQTNVEREIAALNKQIAAVEAALRNRRGDRNTRSDARPVNVAAFAFGETTSAVCLDDLSEQLGSVYRRCGFADDGNVGLLTMLSHIESKLEELLSAAMHLPKETVDASERAREKERRRQYRAEKQEQQKIEHDMRVKRALERAEAPVFKRTGKPEMFRSVVRTKKRTAQRQKTPDGERELREFLSMEL